MAASWLNRLLKKKSRPDSRRRRPKFRPNRFVPDLERLTERIAPAVAAFFTPNLGVMTVLGDNLDNAIVVSRDAEGSILVNGGAVPVLGGTPTVANTVIVQVFGLGGNDTITLDEANGALPKANLFGGAGNDALTSGSGADLLFGQAGNDTLLGKGGADFLFGGAGDDILIGGTGNDQVFGQDGNDRMIWNNGDNTDLNEGGDGIDTVEVNGASAADIFTVAANGTRVRFDRPNLVPFTLDIGSTETLDVNGLGGDDTITAAAQGLAGLIVLDFDGGDGNDQITGSNGADILRGGAGNDTLVGGIGNDFMFGEAGDDLLVWNNGDNSDLMEGGDGNDTVQVNGAAAGDVFTIAPNGDRVRFDRPNLVPFTLDIGSTETLDVNGLGGADTITVNDLTGTDVTAVNLNLAGADGAGDDAADTVIVNGTCGDDVILVEGDLDEGPGIGIAVFGLSAVVNITGSEAANDLLHVNALAGDDAVDASGLSAGAIRFAADGGAGDDVLIGSAGDDVLLGGAGDDVLIGGPGQDVLDGGPGDNILIQ